MTVLEFLSQFDPELLVCWDRDVPPEFDHGWLSVKTEHRTDCASMYWCRSPPRDYLSAGWAFVRDPVPHWQYWPGVEPLARRMLTTPP